MKKEFIVAYMWMFGATERKAKEIYKTSSDHFIREVVASFFGNARKSFYDD